MKTALIVLGFITMFALSLATVVILFWSRIFPRGKYEKWLAEQSEYGYGPPKGQVEKPKP
jgi:hypothetical protein